MRGARLLKDEVGLVVEAPVVWGKVAASSEFNRGDTLRLQLVCVGKLLWFAMANFARRMMWEEVVEEEEGQEEGVKDIYLPAVCNQGLRGLLYCISLSFFELRREPCLAGSLLQPPV